MRNVVLFASLGAVVGHGACAVDDDLPELTEAVSEVEHGGFDPGGVIYDGSIGIQHMACGMCTGEETCSTTCVETNGDLASCGMAGPSCAAARSNVARSSALATAVASSTYSSGAAAAGAINGDRRGLGWASGGGWSDATSGVFPDSLEVRFHTARPISEIDVYTLQDACGMNPSPATCVEPTDAMTFANFGITDFRVQTWNGSAFVDAQAIAGNLDVKRRIELSPPITTSQVRVVVDAARGNFSRIVEVEAWQDASAFDPYLAQALNTRIAMTGVQGCESSPHVTTINGVAGQYKRCNYAWVVASPGNGAWLLPQSHISNLYLGGTVWPATATPAMTSMGFPKGGFHGTDATDNYMVFERGILAKSSAHGTPRRIGGLNATTAGGPLWAEANAALAKAWLDSRLVDKYPVTDTYVANYTGHGFGFVTEANAAGYDSTFLLKYGTTAAFHVDGEIENKWRAATPAIRTSLGWPIANEQRIHANGSAISQFSGGAILWRPTSCSSATFAAEIKTAANGQPTPIYAEGLVGLSCGENVQPCVDGVETPFTSDDGLTGTYQFMCSDDYGWWDALTFRWAAGSGPVSRTVRAPILGRYLSTIPAGTSGTPISVERALATGLGRPLTNAFTFHDATKQTFQRGEILEARPCANTCTSSISCSRTCTDAGRRITCGDYKPEGFAAGKCQLYDIYCELPEIKDVHVLDARESGSIGNGPEAFLYYYKDGIAEKRGRMPVQIGGVGGAPVSEYMHRFWEQAIPAIASHPEKFPFASNLPGHSIVIPDRLQLEFTAHWGTPETALPHPVLAARQCVSLPHPTYGVHPAIPTFPASSLQHVYEDDECMNGICNSDDYIGSIRLYHNDCAAQHWSQGRDLGFTQPRELTNQLPSASPDLGGPGNAGSGYMDLAHYRTYCYRGLDLQKGGSTVIDTWEYGIGSQQHSGFEEP